MNFLIVSNMYPSEVNPGYGVFVRNFEVSLRAQGVSVCRSVIVGRAGSASKKILDYLIFFIRTFVLVLFRRFDCVYVHYVAHSLLPFLLLMPILRVRGTKLVCNAHGEDFLPRSFVEKFIFKLVHGLISGSSLLVVPSEYFAGIARSKFPAANVFVSPSGGVDLDKFKPKTNSGKETNFRLGYVSRIDPGKGWSVLLQAIKRIKERDSELSVSVSFVGEGIEVESLLQSIQDLALQGSVFYLGPMSQDLLPDFYSSLDLFVFPTVLPESLGLVGIEALSCGVPAICSDIGGIRSYMKEGVNGYLFPPGDSCALAQKISDFTKLTFGEVNQLKSAALESARPYGCVSVANDLYAKLIEVIKV